jgi:cytoskeletal protein CcmA (bactofilin family)
MREERGTVAGNITIEEPYTLWGSIAGDVTASEGSKFYMRGAIYGSLTIKRGGRVHVFGNISGDMTVHAKSKVIHSGVVGGDVINLGGRLYIDATAQVVGRVKTLAGETTIEPQARIGQEG